MKLSFFFSNLSLGLYFNYLLFEQGFSVFGYPQDHEIPSEDILDKNDYNTGTGQHLEFAGFPNGPHGLISGLGNFMPYIDPYLEIKSSEKTCLDKYKSIGHSVFLFIMSEKCKTIMILQKMKLAAEQIILIMSKENSNLSEREILEVKKFGNDLQILINDDFRNVTENNNHLSVLENFSNFFKEKSQNRKYFIEVDGIIYGKNDKEIVNDIKRVIIHDIDDLTIALNLIKPLVEDTKDLVMMKIREGTVGFSFKYLEKVVKYTRDALVVLDEKRWSDFFNIPGIIAKEKAKEDSWYMKIWKKIISIF
ncbi:hypothetical protein AYI68_g7044 [Smittium mucronatum]|uniref:Uncharacterized protein n=1 Tax=Smittium mucronatum TaxID=133383 RepID=A0A1R0GPW6_9FUNG|nr:hypothetical protein AYI68_g7044 [Smittium mucronatum]